MTSRRSKHRLWLRVRLRCSCSSGSTHSKCSNKRSHSRRSNRCTFRTAMSSNYLLTRTISSSIRNSNSSSRSSSSTCEFQGRECSRSHILATQNKTISTVTSSKSSNSATPPNRHRCVSRGSSRSETTRTACEISSCVLLYSFQ